MSSIACKNDKKSDRAIHKLPIASTLGRSILFPAIHWRNFLITALLPAAYFAIWLVFLFAVVPTHPSFGLWIFVEIVTAVTSAFLSAAFIVSWHRLVLIGPQAARRKWFPMFERRDWRFAVCFLRIFLLMAFCIGGAQAVVWLISKIVGVAFNALPVVAGLSVASWASIGVALFVLYFTVHWVLMLPAAAIDEPDDGSTAKLADTLIKGNESAFYVIILLLLLVVGFLESLAEWMSHYLINYVVFSELTLPESNDVRERLDAKLAYAVSGRSFLMDYLTFLIGLGGSAVLATMLSLTFRHLKMAANQNGHVGADTSQG